MDEIDYTEIRDDEIRSKICELMSEMLDNPDEHGIYPTSRFMWKMETYCLELVGQTARKLSKPRHSPFLARVFDPPPSGTKG